MEKDICCYVLFSEKLDKFYIGVCQENLQERVLKHNTGYYYGQNFAKSATDWQVYLKIDADSYDHAIRLERKIKSMKCPQKMLIQTARQIKWAYYVAFKINYIYIKSSVYIKNLKIYSDLLHRIQEETRQST